MAIMREQASGEYISWPREVARIVKGDTERKALAYEADVLVRRLREVRAATALVLDDIDNSIAEAEAIRDGRPFVQAATSQRLRDLSAKIESTQKSMPDYRK